MNCPRCKTAELAAYKTKGTGVEIDCCPACKGMWFDAQELETLLGPLAVKAIHVPAGAVETRKRCPRCNVALHLFKYPQTLVKVDMCKQCGGLWLDAGELKEIKVVRGTLAAAGELEKKDPPTGVKGALIRFIDTAIEAMNPF